MNIIIMKLKIGGISMRISSSDIKVKVNYPEQYECDEDIKRTISKWILDQQVEKYGEKNLKIEEMKTKWKELKSKAVRNIWICKRRLHFHL